MDLSISSFAAGLIFGSFGIYAFKRGKTRGYALDIILGLILMIYPYFIENAFLNWGIGISLLLAVYYFRR